MKKLAFVLVIALVLTSASACAETAFNREGYPIVDEVIEFTTLVPRTAEQIDWNDMWIFKWYEEKLGIRFNVEMVDSAAWTEQKNLAFATDSLPDVFISTNAFTANELINYGKQGYLIDLKDLLMEYSPNFQEYIKYYPDLLKSLTTTDGAIYSAPMLNVLTRELDKNNRVYINMQWLKNLGLEVPTTTEELFNVLTAIKENDADKDGDASNEIPFGGMFEGEFPENFLLAAFGFADPAWDIDSEGNVYYVPASDNYYHYLEYMLRLWKAGLIDEEFFSQNTDQFNAKAAAVSYGFFRTGGANWTVMSDEAAYSQYQMLDPILSEYNDVKIAPAKALTFNYGFSITSECENPEILVRWLDYTYSFEGGLRTGYGAELGEVDELNGWKLIPGEDGRLVMQMNYDSDKYSSFNNMRVQLMTSMNQVMGLVPDTFDDNINPNFLIVADPRQRILTNDVMDHHAPYYKTAFPDVIMSDEENSEVTMLETDISTYLKPQVAKFISGEIELTPESFENFVNGLNERGLERYVSLKQAAYERYIGK